jgi:hypothetical protein
MTRQLSLFHTPERADEPPEDQGRTPLETDASALDELFRTSRRWRSSREYMALLDFVARFPSYSPLNGFLIFLQKPEAACIATRRGWLEKYQRQVKPGVRPIVILAPMSPVQFVFDIADTEGSPIPFGALTSSAAMNRLSPKIYENTLNNCRIHHIAVKESSARNAVERALRITPAVRKRHADLALTASQRYAVLLDAGLPLEEKYASLAAEVGRIFCGHLGADSDAWWNDRKDLDLERVDIEAASVAYLICRRRSLAGATGGILAEWAQTDRNLPAFSLNAVFQAVSHIETMGKTPWRRPPKQRR